DGSLPMNLGGGLRPPSEPPPNRLRRRSRRSERITNRSPLISRAFVCSTTPLERTGMPRILRSAAECVMVSSVTPLLTWTLLGGSLAIGIAALVRMTGPATGGFEELTGVIRLPQRMTAAIVSLFTVAALVFFAGLVRRWRARRRGAEMELLTS